MRIPVSGLVFGLVLAAMLPVYFDFYRTRFGVTHMPKRIGHATARK